MMRECKDFSKDEDRKSVLSSDVRITKIEPSVVDLEDRRSR